MDSRLSQDGSSIRRRRECQTCEYRFSTLEEVELLNITVVKRNGRHEAYSREKMERGLRKALEKRSYTDARFRVLIQAIERDLQREKVTEIPSQEIGEIVMRNLRDFDKVAYIRFASVYRSFEDVETFHDELERLLRKPRKKKRGEK